MSSKWLHLSYHFHLAEVIWFQVTAVKHSRTIDLKDMMQEGEVVAQQL